MEKLVPTFEVGCSGAPDEEPSEWYPATVPGAVQLDYARAKGLPPHWEGENFREYGWMESHHWHYRATFDGKGVASGESVSFVSLGIDYRCLVFLNGRELASHEGMFGTIRVDLTSHVLPDALNEIRIVCLPIPRKQDAPEGRAEAADSVKPPMSYGWDWHPRLVPIGIWDETWVERARPDEIVGIEVHPVLSRDLKTGTIALAARFAGGIVPETVAAHSVEVRDPEGVTVYSANTRKSSGKVTVTDPMLWWPIGEGPQHLYTVVVTTETGTSFEHRVGFRSVRLRMNDGAWEEPSGFPKTRSTPPIMLEINGRPIFAKGTNWVPPEIFYGTITPDRYARMIDLAVEANFNILRIWGGGIINKKAFHTACDERGIMVWQEFPLACVEHSDDEGYLAVLESEAIAIVKRLRSHPSLVLWCGGNELFNVWSGMTDQHHALRLLNSITYEHDRMTPFLPTSPVYGMGHGHYVFYDKTTDEEVFAVMQRSSNTAYTEFGMPAASPMQVLEGFLSEAELADPMPGGVWESHHAYRAWGGGGDDTWLCESLIHSYFGSEQSTDRLVFYSQLLQAVGYQAIYEEARRQWPACSMALNWCFNEPWPTAANNSLVAWPDVIKPAFWFVRAACRPVALSAAIRRFSYAEGELLEFDLWLLNGSDQELEPMEVVVTVNAASALPGLPSDRDANDSLASIFCEPAADSDREMIRWSTRPVLPRTNLHGPTARMELPRLAADLLVVRLSCAAHPETDSEYLLSYRQRETASASGPRELNV